MYVLLVEDDERIGGAVRDHVAAAGHAVEWARTLADADAACRAARMPDLVLLDLSLPDGSGLDLLRRLRAARRDCGVIQLGAMHADAPGAARGAAGRRVDGFRGHAPRVSVTRPIPRVWEPLVLGERSFALPVSMRWAK